MQDEVHTIVIRILCDVRALTCTSQTEKGLLLARLALQAAARSRELRSQLRSLAQAARSTDSWHEQRDIAADVQNVRYVSPAPMWLGSPAF